MSYVLNPIELNSMASTNKQNMTPKGTKSHPKRSDYQSIPSPSPAKYAGSALDSSPAPSSLPLPSWRRNKLPSAGSPPAVVTLSFGPMPTSKPMTLEDLELQLLAATQSAKASADPSPVVLNNTPISSSTSTTLMNSTVSSTTSTSSAAPASTSRPRAAQRKTKPQRRHDQAGTVY